MRKRLSEALATTLFFLSAPGMADTVFFDGTFDLSNYSVTNAQSGGGTINSAQGQSAGNPGAVLETTVSSPSTAVFYAHSYIVNNGFSYDPTVSGALNSLSFSLDSEILVNGGLATSNGVSSLIEQSGHFYQFTAPITTQQGVYQTGSASGVTAADYDLITNLITGATDFSRHPNYDGAVMLFGLTAGGSTENVAATIQEFSDNLSYDLNPAIGNVVPLPGSAWLFVSGLFGLLASIRRMNSRSFTTVNS